MGVRPCVRAYNHQFQEDLVLIPRQARCVSHGESLSLDGAASVEEANALVCPAGCRIPVIGGVPRFVRSSTYAAAFGLQWRSFQRTQLDSETGLPISANRLARCLGGTLDVVRGRAVLEVGCGAGRFTELLLASGASVFACDLSEAVEANLANCGHWNEYFVIQADVNLLPAARRSFDIVLALGMIQHTPSPEQTLSALAEFVKPGGMLVIDHYTHGYPTTLPRRVLRAILLRLPASVALKATRVLADIVLPFHRLWWRKGRWPARIRLMVGMISPFVDYFESYPELGERRLAEWAVLDTYDTLTDRYKHLRTLEQIRDALRANGLAEIEVSYGGNGVEARARRPVAHEPKQPSRIGIE